MDAIHHEVDEHLLQLEITQDLYSSGTVLRVENVVDPTLVGCARFSLPSTPPFFEHRQQVIPAVVTRRFRSAQERSGGLAMTWATAARRRCLMQMRPAASLRA